MTLTQSQFLGAMYGLLIGDAVGVPYEFNLPQNLPEFADIDITPPTNFKRTYPTIAVGTWSDDGAQALCLLASLLDKQSLDLNDLARRFLNWQNIGYMAVDYEVFDIGVQTSEMLLVRQQQLEQDVDLNELFAVDKMVYDVRTNGNGSLMRVLPLVLWFVSCQQMDKQNDKQIDRQNDLVMLANLVQLAHQQSWLTHPHPRSQVCCGLYCLWAVNIIAGQDYQLAWQQAITQLTQIYQQLQLVKHLEELQSHICPDDRQAEVTGSGYVVDSLRSAYWAQQQDSYKNVIKASISLGRDTDTTACIAGGIAGLRFGVENMPQDWLDKLRGKDILWSLFETAYLLSSPNNVNHLFSTVDSLDNNNK
ncbi:ADP-ribosylglycohydrolase family protein [Psychrobacter sp. I-STPA6b]|uniref:ADP-ribosylglycohydrolase family protein n=1 Tax=Psychrobacter sp. I-STPA6b TaxID=2585718 RepID=UPI001D0C0A24|nr:ADP-ribosylglycohydrolase family protein [Psychrobacter sp. I-STPA6b]